LLPLSPAQLDEVLYDLAREYELSGDGSHARKTYFELIMKRPASRLIPRAYLAFGELFFEEAKTDPSKWAFAQQAYTKVIGYPPPDNGVYGYAWYKLAHVFWETGDFDSTRNALKKTIDYGDAYAELPGATTLAEIARQDTLAVPAIHRDPGAAHDEPE
jgi:tetratricopeptide (TPR) repeat protein